MAATKRKSARRQPTPAPNVELIVRRGALRRFHRLKKATANLPVTLSWDKRLHERRARATDVASERRQNERRQEPPFTWTVADFLVVVKRGRSRRS